MSDDFKVTCDEKTGQVHSVQLYGKELLDQTNPCVSELYVNGEPLKLRPHIDPHDPHRQLKHLKGEKYVDQFAAWGLVVVRRMGGRAYMKHKCFGIETRIRRELCDQTCPVPGPGGPTVEAPLYVDTFSLANWNWKFWGDDTRMIFPSSHSSGPADEFGHVGYEHDTPENCKKFMQNVWRRIYPGVLVVHGGLYYNVKTEEWMAITCRRPNVGYILNIKDAGRGVGYDFTLHAPWNIGQELNMPEIKIYYGKTRQEMMSWLGDYVTFYYQEPPEWVHRTVWGEGLAWDNEPTWTQQAEYWEKRLDSGEFNGVGYSLVTNRPIHSGTTPLGYEPDPNHGTIEEFKAMCQRVAKRAPLLIWMSHSGVQPGARDMDDDWFIKGIDGRMCASWGSVDGGMTHCNPGHPGYIEYTKKWIRFYIKECGCKGIFFDCLSWAFPPDFAPRSFQRFPGDTNLLAIKFMEEVYACIKECDPEAIMLGEGTSLEGPVNIFSINTDPKRAIDGWGPRDFFLQLNQYAPKRMVIDQGPRHVPSAGMCCMDKRPGSEARNRYLTKLMKEKGGRDAWTHIPGDLSVMGDLLVVPAPNKPEPRDIKLPEKFAKTRKLVEETDGTTVARNNKGVFAGVMPGIYRMVTK